MVNKKNIIIISSIIAGILIFIFCGLFISYFVNKNSKTIIENIDDYYYGIPENVQNTAFRKLHEAINYNSDNVPINQAFIRNDEPFLYNYNQNYDGYTASFVVDIPAVEQSYIVKINFNEGNNNLGASTVVIECLSDEFEMIYADYDCKDYRNFIDGRFR